MIKHKYVIISITSILFVIMISTIIILFNKRKIWFVYPNKSIYQVDGLDISHHQKKIDWDSVDNKYQFVFVKATEGDTFVDTRFYENVSEIKRTQRILGAYHFFHFNYDGIAQAHNYINVVGNHIDLPPVVDFEFSGNPKEFEKEIVLEELKKCVETLENYYGCKAIIYTTSVAYKSIIKDNFDNPLWYRSILYSVNKNMNNLNFWQYHNSARIKGIQTDVDLNVFKGSMIDLQKILIQKEF